MLSFGPLRYHQWTTDVKQETSVPFGPLRYRAWTNGPLPPGYSPDLPPGFSPDLPPEVIPPTVVGFKPGPHLLPRRARRIRLEQPLRDDDEIIAFLASLLQTDILH